MDLQKIDDLCDEFESALRRGESVRIEDCLESVPEEFRPRLLRELLEIEIELSATQPIREEESFSGQPIIRLQESLRERFPEQEELVDSIVRRVAKLRRIGDYEILEELGHGGMGIVFRARQKLLNQIVAIKVLSQTLLNDPQAVGRFRREMQLIGGLNHPNIVRALNAGSVDSGDEQGSHYLVMEFVDGITLQRLCDNIRKEREQADGESAAQFAGPENRSFPATRKGGASNFAETVRHPSVSKTSDPDSVPDPVETPVYSSVLGSSSLGNRTDRNFERSSSRHSGSSVSNSSSLPIFPVAAACEAIRQAALGLQHAHEFGLVHRDVKPANLMLDYQGTVKLLDLGLGKFLDEQRAPGEHTSLTMAGTTIGTIDYISPEQCENAGDVDIRSDLYSLGCTFYFLLIGKPPYSGSRYDTTRKKLMAHIVGEVPNIQKSIPGVPDGLEKILEKLLAKEPSERYQTPLELAEDLEPFSSFEALHELIGGQTSDGTRRTPGSTGRIPGTSHTVQANAAKKPGPRYMPKSARDFLILLLPPVLVLCIIFFLPGIAALRHLANRIRGLENQQRQSVGSDESGAPSVAEIRTLKSNVQTDLALLPGLNGSWWLDETPWFLPFVRDALMRKIEATEDLNAFMGKDPEKYYDANVPDVQLWLWNLILQLRDELTPEEKNLVEHIKEYYGANFNVAVSESSYEKFLDAFRKKHAEEHSAKKPWRAVDLHTLALLEHRLAEIRNDRELAITAARHYAEAIDRYKVEARPGNDLDASPELVHAAFRARKLEFLCLSDSARLEFLATGNYGRAIRKFDFILQQRETGERLGPLFQAELRAAHGALAAAAGQYDDSQFIRGIDMLSRSRVGDRMHPLGAQLSERYAWSLLEQWKVAEAEKQFTNSLFIREANRRESKNAYAAIFVLHDWHGLAMTLRYLGNTDRAVEEYRKTILAIDKELGNCRENSGTITENISGLRRYHAGLRERAANTRERLADCTLYGGAASELFSSGRLRESAKLYEEAAELYDTEGPARTMRAKQAIILLLLNEIEDAERILCDLDEQKRNLLGNQTRTELVRQVAEALLVFQKESAKGEFGKGRQALHQFLGQFTIPTNPVSSEAARRETLELRLFCGEFLVDDALDRNDLVAVRQDLTLLMQPIGDFMTRPQSRPFLRRICDLIVKTQARLYEASRVDDGPGNPALLLSIVRLLSWVRLHDREESHGLTVESSPGEMPTLVVFFLTNDPTEGFVVFYPQDGRPCDLYRLPLTRRQVKGGTRKQGDEWKLDERLVQAVQAERDAGRPVILSWNDQAAWARTEDALLDSDWPFHELQPDRKD